MIQKLPRFFPIELEENKTGSDFEVIDSTSPETVCENETYTSTQKLILKQLRESQNSQGVSLNSEAENRNYQPFEKAIAEFREVSNSKSLSPLEKLFEM